MRDGYRGRATDGNLVQDIDRWKRAMDAIAAAFLETGISPAEGMLIMAKCIGHTLQEIPDRAEREQLLGNLTGIVRKIMQSSDGKVAQTFTWN